MQEWFKKSSISQEVGHNAAIGSLKAFMKPVKAYWNLLISLHRRFFKNFHRCCVFIIIRIFPSFRKMLWIEVDMRYRDRGGSEKTQNMFFFLHCKKFFMFDSYQIAPWCDLIDDLPNINQRIVSIKTRMYIPGTKETISCIRYGDTIIRIIKSTVILDGKSLVASQRHIFGTVASRAEKEKIL